MGSSWHCGTWVKVKNAKRWQKGGLAGGGLRVEADSGGTVWGKGCISWRPKQA